MASKRELVLTAVETKIKAALPFAKVRRNPAKGTTREPGGSVAIFDGAAGDPEYTLSPITYTYSHGVELEFTAPDGAADSGLDAMLVAVGAAFEADRTLGGLTEWVEPSAPSRDDADAPGVVVVGWAAVTLTCIYSTTSPLA